jgi:hypothetical protein
MGPEEIRARVARQASLLEIKKTGSDDALNRCWLGRAFLFRPDELLPVNSSGEILFPLVQLYLPDLPHIPGCLEGCEVITAFIGHDFPEEFEPMGENWLVREYPRLADLVRKDIDLPDSFLKARPVRGKLLPEDWPAWDGGGLDDETSAAIMELENAGEIGDYDDLARHEYSHKVGGFPSFCQTGVSAGEGFEFAFQVSSDDRIRLQIIDSGSFQFYRNPESGEWKIYYDYF